MKNLISLVEGVKGCKFADITYFADGGIPQKVLGKGVIVSKIVRTNCQLNYSYEKAVNNRLEKQGDERVFVAQSLPWGEWLVPNKIITHNGTLYLRYYDVANAETKSLWFVNGRPATAEEFAKILEYLREKKAKSENKTQTAVGLVENQVKPKVVKFENIMRLVVNGKEWQKENEWNELATTTR